MTRHTRDEALAAFENHDAALAPIYDVSEFMDDPHVRERGSIAEVDDADWGTLRMQAVHPLMSETPGRIASAGINEPGAHNDEVYSELGLADELESLRKRGAI
jgi:crotonobetainyl-CoA:carnitine CoA-transferase CaiB-like acyl-CoA transferase